MDLSNAMVVSIGIGTVFFGLICLVFICWLMSRVCMMFVKEKNDSANTPVQTSAAANNAPIANKQEIIAASCAVIAEEIGTDANNIKVVSFKRV